jgi:class 3 adenylate cyclase
VTGGVLRGEKARFQLFGETMNMAACIENTGEKNRIHVSQETADLLNDAGKMNWLKPRENLVSTKAKGTIEIICTMMMAKPLLL